MSVSLHAPRRVSPALVRAARIQARFREMQVHAPAIFAMLGSESLEGDQILGDEGQILTAPPETQDAPETGTTPAPEGANDRALADEIAALDEADFLALNIEADEVERDHQWAQIHRMQAEQLDAAMCGQSCDYSPEIDAARAKIAAINERLFSHDLVCELAS